MERVYVINIDGQARAGSHRRSWKIISSYWPFLSLSLSHTHTHTLSLPVSIWVSVTSHVCTPLYL